MSSQLTRLALDDFRSWNHIVLDFSPGINVLVGKNGIGKTNIVEAVEFLASGSSHRARFPRLLVQRGKSKATIRAAITDTKAIENSSANANASANVSASDVTDSIHTDDSGYQSERKTVYEVTIPLRGAIRARIDSGASQYFRDIAGRVKVVIFSPRDQRIISGDPTARRAFIDSTGIMMFPRYSEVLHQFRQIGKQRAAVLKRLATFEAPSPVEKQMMVSELEVWTSQFIDAGVELTSMRNEIINQLASPFSRIYQNLSDGDSTASLVYLSSFLDGDELNDAFADDESDILNHATDYGSKLADKNLLKELISQRFQRIYPGEVSRGVNLIGPHRDDIAVMIEGAMAQDYASNGEIWTLALALKMAQFEYLSKASPENSSYQSAFEGTNNTENDLPNQQNESTYNNYPILILDDVFAQLDENRRQQIMNFASQKGQVFITVAARNDVPADSKDIQQLNFINIEDLADQAHNGGEQQL